MPLIAATFTLTLFITWVARLWIERHLSFGVPISLIGNLLQLTREENTGVAFGFLKGSPIVPWLSLLALIVLLYFRQILGNYPTSKIALGLSVGGGLANLLDRVGDGSVTDYIDFGIGAWRYPTFNLPDIAISIGLGLVLWRALKGSKPKRCISRNIRR
ncbi:hypothetical protein WA1_49890 [Scytonema hofmannii PCC 7110]|uniref:Lipoprotein signal peptidase n=1 Tax=Scytonema hofmannii PCC 7110 TaxID=128403 RepID=A0A139WQW8_9CYAN|nr:signal peptidase II [Scytonema hofmannii]KYC34844.1 hypothetical protein WA1_49890 [Scytonema hofmannii PCC 7110]